MRAVLKELNSKYKFEYFLFLGMNIINTCIETSNIFLEGMLINSLVYKADRISFIHNVVIIIALNVIRLFLSFFINKIQILNYRKINIDVNDTIIKKLYSKDTLEVLKLDPIQTADRITEDTNEILNFLFQTVNQIISIIISSIIIFIYIIKAKPHFFLFIMILLPAYIILYLILKPKIFKINLELRQVYNEYFSGFAEWLNRYVEIKGNRREEREYKRWKKTQASLLNITRRNFFLNLGMSTGEIVLQLIFQLILFINGGLAVISGSMTIGSFSVLFQYFNQLLGQVDALFSILFDFESFRVAYMRIDQLMSIMNEVDGEIVITKVENIQVHNFNISLDAQKTLFSKKLTCSFNNSGLYVVRGRNGIGKSTFLRTITGLYTPAKKGTILINNIDIDLINKKKLREDNISCLFQDTILPNCVVREYLDMYVNESNENCISGYQYFPKVFSSSQFNIKKVLDKKMTELSTGEIQLVKLYTTILKNEAHCFLLDEPLANIYPELQSDVLSLLNEIAQNNLVIIISHDLGIEEKTKNIRIR